MISMGEIIGYTANSSKSWLIAKPEFFDFAVQKFDGTEIKITKEGKAHLGAVIGSDEFKKEYIKDLINTWIEELQNLQ